MEPELPVARAAAPWILAVPNRVQLLEVKLTRYEQEGPQLLHVWYKARLPLRKRAGIRPYDRG